MDMEITQEKEVLLTQLMEKGTTLNLVKEEISLKEMEMLFGESNIFNKYRNDKYINNYYSQCFFFSSLFLLPLFFYVNFPFPF